MDANGEDMEGDLRRAVIFDLYGTLVDLQLEEDSLLFWNSLASDAITSEKMVSSEQLKGIYTRWIHEVSAHADEGFLLDRVFSAVLAELGLVPTSDNICQFARKFRKYSITHLSRKNYTDDLLRAIRNAGYKLGLLSNTEALLTAYDLDVLGLDDKFDAIVLSSSMGVKKPDKRIFEAIRSRLGIDPKECVFVGDSFDADILGAVNSGMDAVFLTTDASSSQLCEDRQAERIVCAHFDLVEIIDALRSLGFAISPPQEVSAR